MKLNTLSSFITIWLSLSLLSCASLKQPEFRSIENVRISKFGLKQSTLSLDLVYFNPNKTRLKLKKAKGDAWIENNYLGEFKVDSLVRIKPGSNFRLPVKLEIDMKKIFANSLVTLLSKEVLVKVEGKAKVGKSFVYINYPVKYEGKQKLKEMIR